MNQWTNQTQWPGHALCHVRARETTANDGIQTKREGKKGLENEEKEECGKKGKSRE